MNNCYSEKEPKMPLSADTKTNHTVAETLDQLATEISILNSNVNNVESIICGPQNFPDVENPKIEKLSDLIFYQKCRIEAINEVLTHILEELG